MADKPLIEKTFNEDLDVEQRIREGGVLAIIYLEVHGNDENAAKLALENTVFERMAKEGDVNLLEVRMFDIRKDDTEKFSGAVEIKLVSRHFRGFISLIMRYGPTAIEIIEPDTLHLSLEEMQAIVGEVSSMTQFYSSRILSLLKDEERLSIYNKMLGSDDL